MVQGRLWRKLAHNIGDILLRIKDKFDYNFNVIYFKLPQDCAGTRLAICTQVDLTNRGPLTYGSKVEYQNEQISWKSSCRPDEKQTENSCQCWKGAFMVWIAMKWYQEAEHKKQTDVQGKSVAGGSFEPKPRVWDSILEAYFCIFSLRSSSFLNYIYVFPEHAINWTIGPSKCHSRCIWVRHLLLHQVILLFSFSLQWLFEEW